MRDCKILDTIQKIVQEINKLVEEAKKYEKCCYVAGKELGLTRSFLDSALLWLRDAVSVMKEMKDKIVWDSSEQVLYGVDKTKIDSSDDSEVDYRAFGTTD